MTDPKLTLGRDGLGEAATDADYASWLEFVTHRIDQACGFSVDIEASHPREIQVDKISGADDEQRETIHEALRVLWELWCGLGEVDVHAAAGDPLGRYFAAVDEFSKALDERKRR